MKKHALLLIVILFPSVMFAQAAGSVGDGEPLSSPIGAPQFDPSVTIDGMIAVAQSARLELHVDPATASFAVAERGTGVVWRSNPADPESDPIARGENLERLKSQIYVQYHTAQGRLQTMTSHENAVSFGSFSVGSIPDGFRIDYTITENERIWIIPRVISEERYNEWFRANLDSRDFSRVNYYFSFADRDEITDRSMLERYPSLQFQNIYIFQELSRDKGLPLPDYIMEDVESKILSTGYDAQEMERDHLQNGVVGVTSVKPFFDISMEVTLDEDHLVVRVPMDEIRFEESIYPINRVSLLEFFGAMSVDESGYMFVPDGSGSLISLNKETSRSSPHYSNVYGMDHTIPAPQQFFEPVQAHIPVYGIVGESQSAFGVIEDGESFARVVARVSGMDSSYNYVGGEFTVLPRDELELTAYGGSNVVQAHQERLNSGDIRVRYFLFSGDRIGYERMAEEYRAYLTDRFGMQPVGTPGSVPFVLDAVGAIDRSRPVMGVPMTVTEPLSTFADVRTMYDDLQSAGVTDLSVKLSGWMNGGLRHRYPTRLSFERRLGGRTGFSDLLRHINETGGVLYPEVGLLYVRESNVLGGFRPRTQAAARMDRLPARNMRRWINTGFRSGFLPWTYVVSVSEYPRLFERVSDFYRDHSIRAIALRDAGSDVNSDFRRNETVDRQQSLVTLIEQVGLLRAGGMRVMTSAGNAPLAALSDLVVNAPMNSNEFYLADGSVPFYQMVFGSSVRLAGPAINLSGDHRSAFLDAVATGSALSFTLIMADQSVLKHTDYDHYYSVNYATWRDIAISAYTRYNEAFGSSYGQPLIGFERLTESVTRSRFADGTVVLVNYSDREILIDGVKVGPLDFRVLREQS